VVFLKVSVLGCGIIKSLAFLRMMFGFVTEKFFLCVLTSFYVFFLAQEVFKQ
jgi:hypothetical protein